MPARVVIVGGGVTGLAVAHELAVKDPAVRVVLLEGAARLGGKIIREERDGFLLDGGADAWLATKPSPTTLARALGLGDELVGTLEKNRKVYVAWHDKLHALPEGLVLGVPTRILPMIKTGLFSWRAKLRMAMEPLVPRRGLAGDEDESIADFMTRRMGRDATERLAAPLLGGIYAGDARELSVRAAMPQFVEAERAYGSLVLSMRASRKGAARNKPESAFVSTRRGTGALIDALSGSLARDAQGRVEVRKGAGVRRVARLENGDVRGRWAVELAAGEVLSGDHVVLAVPAFAAASCLAALDAELSSMLSAIPHLSSASVFFAFPRDRIAHALDATGYIVPRVLGREALASTWVSSKWEGRAPEGTALLRVFLGGAGHEAILARDDAELVRVARAELDARVGVRGEPLFTRVFRFDKGSPQPLVGHLSRMRKIRERMSRWPGLHAGGGGYEAVGIPACIDQGHAIAREILGATRGR